MTDSNEAMSMPSHNRGGPLFQRTAARAFAREVAIWLAALYFPPPFRINRAQFSARVENSILAGRRKAKDLGTRYHETRSDI